MARSEFASTTALKAVMTEHFHSLAAAARDHSAPIAWCTSVGPAELLQALGFRVYFPENHGAVLGASRTAGRCMPRAHAAGYSQDICSYLTSDIGAYLAGETPLKAYGLEKPPRADVLVFNTNQCRDVRDWFEFYGREWDVPVIGVTSPRMIQDVTPALIDGVAHQLEALVPTLEKVAETRLDAGRLETAMRHSAETSELWKACLETARHRPSPISFFDGTIQMGPAVVLRGLAAAGEYYRTLLAELEERVSAAAGAVAGESYRLYWDGMPVWGKLREHAEMFQELSTCVVASTYCNSWIFDLDSTDPFRSMARASLELFIARAEGPKEAYIERMIELYDVDGIVFHDSRTCPHNSNARYGMPGRLQRRRGIPAVVIEGDQNDLRCYSTEQARTSIEGFVEQLADLQSTGDRS